MSVNINTAIRDFCSSRLMELINWHLRDGNETGGLNPALTESTSSPTG